MMDEPAQELRHQRTEPVSDNRPAVDQIRKNGKKTENNIPDINGVSICIFATVINESAGFEKVFASKMAEISQIRERHKPTISKG